MNIINQLSEIQDKLKIISAYLETNNLKEEEKMESLNELRIIEAIVSKPIDNHEKSIKSALELTESKKLTYKLIDQNQYETIN
jgi:hypothetical protein